MHTFHQKEAHLRANGFWFVRYVKHGAIWTDGTSRITVSRSTNHAHEFMKDVGKALARRPKSEDKPKEQIVRTHENKGFSLGDVVGPQLRAALAAAPVAPIKPVSTEPANDAVSRGARLAGTKKYSDGEREVVRGLIKGYRRDGMTYNEIAEQLGKDGVLTPNGKVPDAAFVQNQMNSIGPISNKRVRTETHTLKVSELPKQDHGRKAPAPSATPKVEPPQPSSSPSLPRAVVSILTDPALDSARKVKALSVWSRNATIHDVLTDPELSPDEKIAMLAALAE